MEYSKKMTFLTGDFFTIIFSYEGELDPTIVPKEGERICINGKGYEVETIAKDYDCKKMETFDTHGNEIEVGLATIEIRVYVKPL